MYIELRLIFAHIEIFIFGFSDTQMNLKGRKWHYFHINRFSFATVLVFMMAAIVVFTQDVTVYCVLSMSDRQWNVYFVIMGHTFPVSFCFLV